MEHRLKDMKNGLTSSKKGTEKTWQLTTTITKLGIGIQMATQPSISAMSMRRTLLWLMLRRKLVLKFGWESGL